MRHCAVAAAALLLASLGMSGPARAQPAGTTSEQKIAHSGAVALKDFTFHDGSHLPELKLGYTTLGEPHRGAGGEIDNAVLLIHGTGGSGASYLVPEMAKALFDPGAPFDKDRYYVILPDMIGHGASSKPSDGLRMAFPAYDLADMVEAQRRVLVERMGIKRLKLIGGMSMGGMVTFQWATTHPDMAEKFLPIGAYPVEVAGQNRMQRKLAIDAIKADPAWQGGNYMQQPLSGLRTATSIQMLMSGSALNLQTTYPTRETADRFVERSMAASLASGRDANDAIYQSDATRTYNPWDGLSRIRAALLWINFADDLINPVSLGIADKALARMPNARFVLVPASEKTRGHGTLGQPEYWIDEVKRFMAE
ncbi:MAG: alpha/beta fold hydrolase [Sphingomonas sp.]|nr:alpha/beta fold hydrolase [Sphingomonas sp.]